MPLHSAENGESESEKAAGAAADKANEEQPEHLTGLKLLSIVFSVTLVGFLMLLDTSIVSTVRNLLTSLCLFVIITTAIGCSQNYDRFQISQRRGLVRDSIPLSKVSFLPVPWRLGKV